MYRMCVRVCMRAHRHTACMYIYAVCGRRACNANHSAADRDTFRVFIRKGICTRCWCFYSRFYGTLPMFLGWESPWRMASTCLHACMLREPSGRMMHACWTAIVAFPARLRSRTSRDRGYRPAFICHTYRSQRPCLCLYLPSPSPLVRASKCLYLASAWGGLGWAGPRRAARFMCSRSQ